MRRNHHHCCIAAAAVVVGLVAPGASRAAAVDLTPEVALELPWGSGLLAVGRDDGNESSPEGPMSFTVAENGDLYILDQVNERVVRYHADGRFYGALTLPGRTFEDLAITADGKVLVLDRLVRSSILVFDAEGSEMGEYEILGDGIPQGGGVTAIFARNDGIWLEYNNAYIVKVLDPSTRPCPRAAVPGRLALSGPHSVGARLDGAGGAWIWINDLYTRSVRNIRNLNEGNNIQRISWIETDGHNRIYMMVHLVDYEEENPLQVAFEGNLVMVMDANLDTIALVDSAHTIAVWEQHREFKVSSNGDIYQMALTEEGLTIFRWRWKR